MSTRHINRSARNWRFKPEPQTVEWLMERWCWYAWMQGAREREAALFTEIHGGYVKPAN